MDLQKEREAFEKECRLLCYKGNMVMSNLGSFYNNEQTNWMWQMWLSAKARAAPDTYTPIVLALEDVQSKIAKTSFLTMDEENENEVMAVNANELAAYIDELIEAQEQK